MGGGKEIGGGERERKEEMRRGEERRRREGVEGEEGETVDAGGKALFPRGVSIQGWSLCLSVCLSYRR